jgi:hypothetical protein
MTASVPTLRILGSMSPVVHREDGYRFFFWSNERRAPPHIHVAKAGATATWWLAPIAEAFSAGFNAAQRRRIRDILETQAVAILKEWYERFPEAP